MKINTELKQSTGTVYEESIHRVGRVTGVIALLFIIAVPAIVCLQYNIFPPLSSLFKGLLTVCMIYIPICLAEVLTYTPMLGSGASYLVFVSGNLTNLKIPCATLCLDLAGVEPATKEGDIISTISTAVSTIVTELVIIIGLIALVPLKPILNSPVLAPAFENILPALFGALGVYWIMKEWKLAVVPLSLVIMISIFIDIQMTALIPVLALFSILAARIMYKKGWI